MIKVEVEGEVGNTFRTESTVAQEQYEALVENQSGIMTASEAKKYVAEEYGFAEDKIEILDHVTMYVYVGGGKWKPTTVVVPRHAVCDKEGNCYVLFRVCGTVYESFYGGQLRITRVD